MPKHRMKDLIFQDCNWEKNFRRVKIFKTDQQLGKADH